jgi:geranylgeranyl transferase type-2 subunit beta
MSENKESTIPEENTNKSTKFLKEKHIEYIINLDKNEQSKFEYYVTEHLRMSAIYWALGALDLVQKIDALEKEKIIKFVLSCQHENGGFGGNVNHDPHLLYTLSAVQILIMLDSLDKIDKNRVVECK